MCHEGLAETGLLLTATESCESDYCSEMNTTNFKGLHAKISKSSSRGIDHNS